VPSLDVKRSEDGRLIARRHDGKSLTAADREQARIMVQTSAKENVPAPRAWVIEEILDSEGRVRALKICSAFVEDHLYLAFDPSFEPRDGLAIYYPEEIERMRDRSPERIREIHKWKLTFPGARVIH